MAARATCLRQRVRGRGLGSSKGGNAALSFEGQVLLMGPASSIGRPSWRGSPKRRARMPLRNPSLPAHPFPHLQSGKTQHLHWGWSLTFMPASMLQPGRGDAGRVEGRGVHHGLPADQGSLSLRAQPEAHVCAPHPGLWPAPAPCFPQLMLPSHSLRMDRCWREVCREGLRGQHSLPAAAPSHPAPP